MNLVKLKDDLYIPENFAEEHHYFADPEAKKEYTGITSVIGVLAKPALIQWSANLAAAAAYLAVAPATFKADLEAAVAKFGKINSDACKVLDKKYPEFKAARTAHTARKKDAATHGTDAHAVIEEYIKHLLEEHEGRPQASPCLPEWDSVSQFVDWAFKEVDHFEASERAMSNAKLFIAGTCDFICVMKDGKRLIGDFKTSSGVYGIDYFLQCAGYKILAEGEGDKPYDGCVIFRIGKDGPEDWDVTYDYNCKLHEEAFLACLTIYRAIGAYK